MAAVGGREIKNVGDGLMVAFASAAAGVACAVDMQRREAAASSGRRAELRVGISVGDAEVDGNDYFGTPVIEASRLCAAASGGQILVSELVRVLAGGRGAYAYAATGPIELKGFDQPVQAFEVTAEPAARHWAGRRSRPGSSDSQARRVRSWPLGWLDWSAGPRALPWSREAGVGPWRTPRRAG